MINSPLFRQRRYRAVKIYFETVLHATVKREMAKDRKLID
jgi:hypothetical protein